MDEIKEKVDQIIADSWANVESVRTSSQGQTITTSITKMTKMYTVTKDGNTFMPATDTKNPSLKSSRPSNALSYKSTQVTNVTREVADDPQKQKRKNAEPDYLKSTFSSKAMEA